MCYTLPNDFTSDDVLPIGTYEVTFDDLRASLLVQGPRSNVMDS